MSKLTKEQIEKERVKFEEEIKKQLPDLVDLRRAKNGDKEYMCWVAIVGFTAWLARAELDKEYTNGNN